MKKEERVKILSDIITEKQKKAIKEYADKLNKQFEDFLNDITTLTVTTKYQGETEPAAKTELHIDGDIDVILPNAGGEIDQKTLDLHQKMVGLALKNRQELIRRIRDGALGEIQMVRAYRMQPVGPLSLKPADEDELAWQIRNFVCFFWVSGGLFAEMDIHQIDEICWVKDAWPTSAHGIGGRCPDSTDRSQNLDSYCVEWTFPDGTKAHDVVRYLPGCHNEFATYVHGTKCAAQFSGNVHAGTVQIYKDQRCSPDNVIWKMPDEEITPWQAEWNVFLEAIRRDRLHNEAERAALSNLADMMGRAAVHTGKIVTWDQAMNSPFQWCPELDQLNEHSTPPLQADDRGHYPAPVPGTWSEI